LSVATPPVFWLNLNYHLVFSTKGREPVIAAAWRSKLHGYFRGVVEGLGGQCEIVGGADDHVHLLVRLNAMHRLADVMRELKKASSAWVREDRAQRGFAWQEGYAAFTVSASGMDEVRRYIENQEEHHRERSFREELVIMLKRSGVKYDERYLD
jgi:putative transposase